MRFPRRQQHVSQPVFSNPAHQLGRRIEIHRPEETRICVPPVDIVDIARIPAARKDQNGNALRVGIPFQLRECLSSIEWHSVVKHDQVGRSRVAVLPLPIYILQNVIGPGESADVNRCIAFRECSLQQLRLSRIVVDYENGIFANGHEPPNSTTRGDRDARTPDIGHALAIERRRDISQ